jgi:hypothetical protein
MRRRNPKMATATKKRRISKQTSKSCLTKRESYLSKTTPEFTIKSQKKSYNYSGSCKNPN